MKATVLVCSALLAAGCGGHKSGPAMKAAVVAAYPGATQPHTSANATFATTDWTLAAGAASERIYDWYTAKLLVDGWRITQRNETGLHATRRGRTLDVGVRGRTLEVVTG